MPRPVFLSVKYSSSASKYFKRGAHLNWPEGALSRESIRAVRKLDRLKAMFFSMPIQQQLVNNWRSAGKSRLREYVVEKTIVVRSFSFPPLERVHCGDDDGYAQLQFAK
ncbi:Serine/threonine-protein kinase AFC3 [Dendrobium catenatum]|uniref:Serine/threonine-protein kinase AFC3 n=1 Tax=Dendrobium catenatum TaxID=906689 RepID=A0A2I0WCM2_9ASPA|nr:Serine/threonine-protein kinase AFC3 [Dendrobium catenatum]